MDRLFKRARVSFYRDAKIKNTRAVMMRQAKSTSVQGPSRDQARKADRRRLGVSGGETRRNINGWQAQVRPERPAALDMMPWRSCELLRF